MPANKPLIPPDRNQCQAIKPGDSWMRFGGRHQPHRCDSTPTVIATEKKAGKDNRKGSMSLCDHCQKQMIEQCGADFATFTVIKRKSQ